MRYAFALIAGLTLSSSAVLAQSQSITPSASVTGDNTAINQTSSSSTSTQSNSSTQNQTINGTQINNSYINPTAAQTNTNSSIRPHHDDPQTGRTDDGYYYADRHDHDSGGSDGDHHDRDLLRARDHDFQDHDILDKDLNRSDRDDLVRNRIDAESDAQRADSLLRSTLQGSYNAQSINNRAPDTGRVVRPNTGPDAIVQFAPPAVQTVPVATPVVDSISGTVSVYGTNNGSAPAPASPMNYGPQSGYMRR